MTIEKIKKEMLEYRDFYGGDLLESSEIKSATTKKQLKDILDRHASFMEDQLSDALSTLDRFKEKLGLRML